MNTNKDDIKHTRNCMQVIFGIVLGLAAVVTLVWTVGLAWLLLRMLNII